jgi:hypothetical protein
MPPTPPWATITSLTLLPAGIRTYSKTLYMSVWLGAQRARAYALQIYELWAQRRPNATRGFIATETVAITAIATTTNFPSFTGGCTSVQERHMIEVDGGVNRFRAGLGRR